MKKLTKIVAVVAVALLFSCSSDDGGSSTSSDKIVGKWKMVSSKENGVTQDLDACDLMERSDFKSNGILIAEDYDLENGECVLQDPSEPGLTLETKWRKLGDNSYEMYFMVNGVENPMTLPFTTEFSNGNNTVTTTATEPDGDVVVSVMEKV